MKKKIKKYKMVFILHYDDQIEDTNVFDFALSNKYLKELCANGSFWPETNNKKKVNWHYLTFKEIQNIPMSKKQVDYTCQQNPELCGKTFKIVNTDPCVNDSTLLYTPIFFKSKQFITW